MKRKMQFAKRILSMVLCLVMVLTYMPMTALAAENISVVIDTGATISLNDQDGDGIYEISTADELYAFAVYVNEGNSTIHGRLTADIVVNTDVLTQSGELNANSGDFRVWTPIGKHDDQDQRSYRGIFDGQWHTISGLYVNDAEANYVGLFGLVDGGCVVNVGVIDSYMAGNDYVGGVVAMNQSQGEINACYNNGIVSGSEYIGGVVGYNTGRMVSCSNTGKINGDAGVGGVVGYNREDANITECLNQGVVSGRAFVGGVIGANAGTIQRCTNDGSVNGTETTLGGVVGKNTGVIDDCYNSTHGNLTGVTQVGGVTGENQGTIQNCHNEALIIGENGKSVGGVAGTNEGTIQNCHNEAPVIGENGKSVGGVIGANLGASKGVIKNCYNTDNVRGAIEVGGVAGINEGTIQNCYNTGIYQSEDRKAGGVVGTNSKGKVWNCYNTGNAVDSGNYGGVIGSHIDNAEFPCVLNCYYVAGNETVGIYGQNDENGKVEAKSAEQFASGEVTYLLNQGQNTITWYQTCGEGLPDFWGRIVYYGYTTCSEDQIEPIYTNDSTASVNKPVHDFSNGKCECGEKAIPSVTITPATLNYTGEAQALISTGSTNGGVLYYSLDNENWSPDIPEATNIGTYTVYYKVVGDDNYKDVAAQSVEVTIAKAVPSYTAPTANHLIYGGAPQALISAGSTNDGTILYALGENDSVAPENGWGEEIPTGLDAGEYYVWYKVEGDEKHNSSAAICVVVHIGKRTPDLTAPTPNELTFNGIKQALIVEGTASAGVLYYRLDNEGWSTSIPAATEAGTYTVYYKVVGDENYEDIEVKTLNVTIKAKSCAEFEVLLSQNSYKYDNTAKEPNVTVKDRETTLVKGRDYEVNYENNVNVGRATVIVTFKGNYIGTIQKNFMIVDDLAPVGSVSVKENSWNSFWNWITFGLFFKDTVDVTVMADGTGSDVVKVEYLLSREDLSNVSMPTEGWTTLMENDGKYSFSILPQNKTAVYVRITDAANNVTIINSAGIVVYEDSVITQSVIDYVYKENSDRILTITVNGNIFDKLTDTNGDEIDSTYYTVEDDKLTLKADYLNTLDKGEYTYKVYMKPMGVETTAVTLEYTFKVNVTAKILTVTGATATNKDYDGTKDVDITGLTLSGIKDTDIVGVSFENLTGTLSSANVGTYTSVTLGDLTSVVTLTGEDKDNYRLVFTGGTVATDVTIEKISVTIPTAPVANRLTYNTFAQTLVTAGVANGGTMMYSLYENGTYTEEIPTATNAGNYTVWYYVKGDGNHNDSAKASIAVNVEKATPDIGTVFATIPDNSTEIDQIMLGCGAGMVDGNLSVDAGQSLVWGANEIAYTFTPVDTNNYNAVTGKVTVDVKDTVAPTVEYRIGTNAWKAFINTVSFGLFCKDYKTVEIQAADTLSGIQKIEYFVADKKMTAKELADATWKTYTGSIDLNATGKYIVYARVTDKDGNMTEEGISTEGIVIYEDSKVGASASYEYNSGESLHIEYFENGNSLKEILYNGQPLTHGLDGDYAMAANANVLSFMPAFLDTLEVGAHEFTFVFNPQGVETTAVSLTKTFTLTVTPAPHIENEEGKMGWDAIVDEVEDVLGSDENTIVVDMNGFTEVSGDFLDSIKGKDVDVEFDLGNGIVWTVNGKDITGENLEDIDFAVTVNTEENPNTNIPLAVINKVIGENFHTEISLAHDGEFGFTAVLTLNLDAENAGLFANLYYYNSSKQELEFICADEIAADGSADLTFTHASDYTIVIDEVAADTEEPDKPQEPDKPETPDTPENPDGVQPPETGDDTNVWVWAILLVAGFGMVVLGQRRRVR